VSPHKGLHVLLDAFSIVVSEYPEVRLDVVGVQANYPLAENFDLQERELIESVYPFYAYDWKAKLSLAPADCWILSRPTEEPTVGKGAICVEPASWRSFAFSRQHGRRQRFVSTRGNTQITPPISSYAVTCPERV
jgi:hypothetical protein